MSDQVLERIQKTAKEVHNNLRTYYEAWEELETMAQGLGYSLDTKTAELKPKE